MNVKTEWNFDVGQCGRYVAKATAEGIDLDCDLIIPWVEIDAARGYPSGSLIARAALGMLDHVQPAIDKALQNGEDATGLGTVRDAVACMFENKSDTLQMYFFHGGRKCNVEIRILQSSLDKDWYKNVDGYQESTEDDDSIPAEMLRQRKQAINLRREITTHNLIKNDALDGVTPTTRQEFSKQIEAQKVLLKKIIPEWELIIGMAGADGREPKTEYRAWLAAQPAEYQHKINNINNALEIGASIKLFQESNWGLSIIETEIHKAEQKAKNQKMRAALDANPLADIEAKMMKPMTDGLTYLLKNIKT